MFRIIRLNGYGLECKNLFKCGFCKCLMEEDAKGLERRAIFYTVYRRLPGEKALKTPDGTIFAYYLTDNLDDLVEKTDADRGLYLKAMRRGRYPTFSEPIDIESEVDLLNYNVPTHLVGDFSRIKTCTTFLNSAVIIYSVRLAEEIRMKKALARKVIRE